jgi:hypothetical protein
MPGLIVQGSSTIIWDIYARGNFRRVLVVWFMLNGQYGMLLPVWFACWLAAGVLAYHAICVSAFAQKPKVTKVHNNTRHRLETQFLRPCTVHSKC